MKKRLFLTMILLALVYATGAVGGVPGNVKVLLHPDGTILSPNAPLPTPRELDTEWPDSIYYFDPEDYSSLYTGTNLWSGTRFTAPADFILEGIRFLPLNQYNNRVNPCEVWIYGNTNGQPRGDLHGGAIWNELVANWPDWNEIVLDEVDYIEFNAGQDFWIVYGPAPGGTYDQNHGWWNLVDSAPVAGQRSKLATTRGGNYTVVQGDFFIVAEGEVSEFFDLVCAAVYNDIQMFHLTVDEEVQLSALIRNTGNVDSPEFDVTFTVEDVDGVLVYEETVNVPGCPGEDEITIDAPEIWSPLFNSRHVVTVTITVAGDPDVDNNVNYLLQNVIGNEDWYAYDDGTFESETRFSDGNGWAVGFTPISHPAICSQGMWYFDVPEPDPNVDLQLWSIVEDEDGNYFIEQLWTNDGDGVDDEWTTYDLSDQQNPDGFTIQEGDFVLMYIFENTDQPFPKDDTDPTSAQNTMMPHVAYQVADFGDSWWFDRSGNWGMRAYIGIGTAPELSVPVTTFEYGNVPLGEEGTVLVQVINNGEGLGVVDSVRLGLPRDMRSGVPFPILIEGNSTFNIPIIWVPSALGPINRVGTVAGLLYHNDMNLNNPVTLLFHGTGVELAPPHFEPVEPTGRPYAIVVDNALLDEVQLVQYDEIGVFDGDLCVGAGIVDGNWPMTFSAWQGDPAMQLPGFVIGHPIIYWVWCAEDEEEYRGTAQYIRGDGTFGFGAYTQIILNAMRAQTMTLPLQGRYFELISHYVVPPSMNAMTLFSTIQNLEIVYQSDGGIVIPALNINTIGNISLTQGYQVFCNVTSQFEVTGPLVDPTMQYTLATRVWNWISYPFNFERPITQALAPIAGVTEIVQTDDGGIWIPPIINTIGNMTPGEGYFVYVNTAITFQYAMPVMMAAGAGEVTELPVVEGAPAATGLPYAVLVSLSDELIAQNASIIELYDGSLLVGKAGVWEGKEQTPVIAWGGSAEYDVAGFTPGHQITVKVLDALGNYLPSSSTSAAFGESGYGTITLEAVELPAVFTVGQGYPNPFNPSITVPYAVPTAGEVQIAIYNLLGREVYRTTQQVEAGLHQLVFDANRDGAEMVSSMYFLQLQFQGVNHTQKVMLLK